MKQHKKSPPIHLSVNSNPENLKHIRRVISETVSKTSLSKEEAGCIILAVDEACSNIMKHSYNNDYNRKIDLSVKLEPNALVISIIDDGIRFDINSIEERDVREVKPGGLGLFIIKQVMNTVEYYQTPEGFNIIKMVKKLLP